MTTWFCECFVVKRRPSTRVQAEHPNLPPLDARRGKLVAPDFASLARVILKDATKCDRLLSAFMSCDAVARRLEVGGKPHIIESMTRTRQLLNDRNALVLPGQRGHGVVGICHTWHSRRGEESNES